MSADLVAQAERAVVGGALAFPDHAEAVAADLSPDALDDLALRQVWAVLVNLLADGHPVDALTVAARAGVDVAQIAALAADAVPPIREHVEIVLRAAARRRAGRIEAELRAALVNDEDPFAVAARAAAALDAVAERAGGTEPEAVSLLELMERPGSSSPWVVPGLLRSDWRAVIVSSEGSGKSILLRQIALAASVGVHPLAGHSIPPIRSLVVDAENPEDALREPGPSFVETARRSATCDPDRCKVWRRPGGLDLRDPADRAAFVRELRAHAPALVCAGPLYKLGRRQSGESYEEHAEALLGVLDDLRTRFGFALVLEHHAPKQLGKRRDMTPFGSQRWLAWPEIGIGLVPDRERPDRLRLERFRGDRLRSWWPDAIDRGASWPFEGVWQDGVPGPSDYEPLPRLTLISSNGHGHVDVTEAF